MQRPDIGSDLQPHIRGQDLPMHHQGANLTCKAAAEADVKIEKLGELYNELEELLYKLECAGQTRDNISKRFEERLRVLEEYREDARSLEEKPSKTVDISRELKADTVDLTPLEEQLALHQSSLSDFAQRLRQLEAKQPSSAPASSQSTHEVAQSLIERLRGGDVLHPTDVLELEAVLHKPLITASLDSREHLQTPSLTESTTRQSTTDAEPGQLKRKPGRPRRSLESNSSDEPLAKRMRGRPPRTILESNSHQQSFNKRPVGRPPKYLQPLNKFSVQFTPSQVDTSAQVIATNTARDNAVLTNENGTDAESVVSTEAVASPNAAQKANTLDESQTMALVNDLELTEVAAVRAHTPKSHEGLGDGEGLSTKNEFRVLETGERVVIPPERRSGRKPKPTKPFGEVISWKAANLQMPALRRQSPSKIRS